jgi:hypothetical protein
LSVSVSDRAGDRDSIDAPTLRPVPAATAGVVGSVDEIGPVKAAAPVADDEGG